VVIFTNRDAAATACGNGSDADRGANEKLLLHLAELAVAPGAAWYGPLLDVRWGGLWIPRAGKYMVFGFLFKRLPAMDAVNCLRGVRRYFMKPLVPIWWPQ
jgi:hypothetical protein